MAVAKPPVVNNAPKGNVAEQYNYNLGGKKVISSRNISTPSISAALGGKKRASVQSSSVVQESQAPMLNQPNVEKIWGMYAQEQNSPQLRAALLNGKPILKRNNVVEFMLPNKLYKDRFDADFKTPIENYLKKKFDNLAITMNFPIQQEKFSQNAAAAPDRKGELNVKFNDLKKTYPVLQKLEEIFGLSVKQ